MKCDALAPAHRPGHLRDEVGANAIGIADGARRDIGDERNGFGLPIVVVFSASAIAIGGRLHQRAMEGRRHRQQQRALGALELGELHRPLDRGLRPGDHDLSAAVVVGGLADRAGQIEVARRLGGDRRDRGEVEAEDRRHRAFADRDRLLHRLAAQAQAAAPRPRGVSAPAAQSAEYSPSEWPATKAASRATSKPASLSSARSAAMLVAISAGCALAVSVSSASGPSKISFDSFCAERRVDALEHLARGGKRLGERLAHADAL